MSDSSIVDPTPDGQPGYGGLPIARSEVAGTHLLDYVRVLHKRRGTVLTIFLLVFGLVTVYTFTATPIFEARARLLIEADQQNVVMFKQVVEEDQPNLDYYQTQYNILRSRALARRTLEELKLWRRAPFGTPPAAQDGLMTRILRAPTTLFTGFRSASTTAPAAADETAAQSRAIDTFLSCLTITPIRNSRLVDIRFRLPDPVVATAIVNSLTRGYIAQNLEYKFMASKEASQWLGQQLDAERQAVEKAESMLQQYRERNDSISLADNENITVQKLADLNAAVTRAKTERIQKEAIYRQIAASNADSPNLDTFPAILENAFIQRQKGDLADLERQLAQTSDRLGDKHPEMIKLKSAIQMSQAKLTSEVAKVVASVRSEYQAALAQENSLTAALNQQKTEALSMNRKAIDYGVLARDVESSKQLYNNLLQRAKETSVAGELKTSNIRVVDPAEPPRAPVSPRKATNELLALLLGTALACGLAFFFEYLDNRIKSPEEMRDHLGLAHLGLLPALAPHGDTYPLLSAGVPPNFSEAFRAFRTNVLFSTAEEGARTLVITSTGPREGKSMVAANLALSLAQAGQRVLIVDADMRRPQVQGIFGGTQDAGLSNVLVGSVTVDAAINESSITGLSVMPAGRIPPNPAELLGSLRFRDLMTSLKTQFDWIVFDSPPVMAVIDAALVAHHATGVVFVVGAEMTSRHAAKRAVEQLKQVHAKIVGGVLNRVDLQRNGYYYSQYYRREYAQYYSNA